MKTKGKTIMVDSRKVMSSTGGCHGDAALAFSEIVELENYNGVFISRVDPCFLSVFNKHTNDLTNTKGRYNNNII